MCGEVDLQVFYCLHLEGQQVSFMRGFMKIFFGRNVRLVSSVHLDYFPLGKLDFFPSFAVNSSVLI